MEERSGSKPAEPPATAASRSRQPVKHMLIVAVLLGLLVFGVLLSRHFTN